MSSKAHVVSVSTVTSDQVVPSALTWMRLSFSRPACVPLTRSVVSLVTKSLLDAPVSSVIAVMATISAGPGTRVSIVTLRLMLWTKPPSLSSSRNVYVKLVPCGVAVSSKLHVLGVSCVTLFQVLPSLLICSLWPGAGALVPLTRSVVSLVTKSLELKPVSVLTCRMASAGSAPLALTLIDRTRLLAPKLPAMSSTRAW
ncbi:hypothetical protein H8R02_28445 [Ramlibacter sp. GTP1]|uniref:Uncharacterized protein n=1 Tax=Ramlibacter albus TaxID=2079448 RepID=A0A923S5A8_9BURK|nr:hypothetical protein [Ramlibacter albus]MBC5768424.1 hypothetical protein [Ramlibacter albus]